MKPFRLLLQSFTLFIACLLPASLIAQDKTYADFDFSGDNVVEKIEFITIFKKFYVNDWDSNDDERLDDEDFYITIFSVIDENDDNFLQESEWGFGFDYFYGKHMHGDFDMYDKTQDQKLSFVEFRRAMAGTEYYYGIDINRDNLLSEDELAEAVFENWDIDDDDRLSESEFSRFDSYYLDI